MPANNSKTPDVLQLLADLEHKAEFKHQPVETSGLDPHMALLRVWQANRLAQTYADFLNDKQYRPACLFFLSDIYAARDYSQRDYDLERIYAVLSRFFPDTMLELLINTVKLNQLTHKLDAALVRALVDDLGVTQSITARLYAEGYRLCDNYRERVDQIKLIVKVARQVDEGARLPLVGPIMKLAKVPAQRAGWGEAYDFLERGYAAFKSMRDVEKFVRTVEKREMQILDRIFAGSNDPFK